MNYRVRRFKIFLFVILTMGICFLYMTLVLPFQKITIDPIPEIQKKQRAEIGLSELLDVSSRNYKECLETREVLAKNVELYNTVEIWQQWARRGQICESYKKRLENLQREIDEKK
jgi:hypothetical protein